MHDDTLGNRLRREVRKAASSHVPSEEIEALVSTKSWINSLHEEDRNALLGVDIEVTSGDIAKGPLKTEHYFPVVYWGGESEDQNARIVGIAWKGETANYFEGIVYPPE